MPRVSRQIVVSNSRGLHARPAMEFVDAAGAFTSTICVRKSAAGQHGEIVADGKSVMQMITLAATQGTPLTIEAEGPDAESAVAELAGLFEARFGED